MKTVKLTKNLCVIMGVYNKNVEAFLNNVKDGEPISLIIGPSNIPVKIVSGTKEIIINDVTCPTTSVTPKKMFNIMYPIIIMMTGITTLEEFINLKIVDNNPLRVSKNKNVVKKVQKTNTPSTKITENVTTCAKSVKDVFKKVFVWDFDKIDNVINNFAFDSILSCNESSDFKSLIVKIKYDKIIYTITINQDYKIVHVYFV